jgi:hypothetical protein
MPLFKINITNLNLFPPYHLNDENISFLLAVTDERISDVSIDYK